MMQKGIENDADFSFRGIFSGAFDVADKQLMYSMQYFLRGFAWFGVICIACDKY